MAEAGFRFDPLGIWCLLSISGAVVGAVSLRYRVWPSTVLGWSVVVVSLYLMGSYYGPYGSTSLGITPLLLTALVFYGIGVLFLSVRTLQAIRARVLPPR